MSGMFAPFKRVIYSDPSLEPTLMLPFVKTLFSCQIYEKSSIQKCIASIADNCLGQFFEPSYIIYDLHAPTLSRAVADLQCALPKDLIDDNLVERGRLNVLRRNELEKSCMRQLVRSQSKKLH